MQHKKTKKSKVFNVEDQNDGAANVLYFVTFEYVMLQGDYNREMTILREYAGHA